MSTPEQSTKSDPNAITTEMAFQKAEIRLAHVRTLLSVVADEVRATPLIVGDAELAKLRRLLREAQTIAMQLHNDAVENS